MGQRKAQFTERIADGIHGIADTKLIRVTEFDRLEILRIDLDDGNIVALVIADQFRFIILIIISCDSDGVGSGDDMIVCQDITVVCDDETRTGSLVG